MQVEPSSITYSKTAHLLTRLIKKIANLILIQLCKCMAKRKSAKPHARVTRRRLNAAPPTPVTPQRPMPTGGQMRVAFPGIAAELDAANATLNAIANPNAATVGRAVGSLARVAMKSRHTQTKTRRRRKQDTTAYTSGGKFSKKTKKNIFQKYTKKGVVMTKEHGTSVSGTVVSSGENAGVQSLPVYVGHSTHGDVYLICRAFWRAVVRDIFNLHGVNIVDMETESPGVFTIVINYTTNTDLADVQISQPTTGASYNQIAGTLYTTWNTVTASAAGLGFLMIKDVTLTDGTRTLAKRDYTTCKVHCLVKSDLKIQNRTIAAGTDEDANSTENVSNQPLYGKSYYGKGNGLLAKVQNTTANQGKSLLTSEISGLLTYTLATFTQSLWLNEPPLPTLLEPKPKYTRANIEPGTIKTSSLVAKMTVKQSEIWQILQLIPSQGLANRARAIQSRYGQYRIYAFEKMICASVNDTAPSLGMELNNRIGLYFSFPRNKAMAEICEKPTFI
nr:MAG: capsid protein [Virus sp.]